MLNNLLLKKMGGVTALLVGTLAISNPVFALSTFTFDSNDNGLSTINKTDNGVTITLSNINSIGGNFSSVTNVGIRIGSGSLFGNQFDISFDSDVQLISYTAGSSANTDKFFTLTNPNGADSTGNSLPRNTLQTVNFNNAFSLNAGQTSTFLGSTYLSRESSALLNITVDTITASVPFEFNPTLGLVSLGLLWTGKKFLLKKYSFPTIKI